MNDRTMPTSQEVAEFEKDIPANLALLAAHIDCLSARDIDFATSLLAGYEKYERFTEKQLPWITKLWLLAKADVIKPVELVPKITCSRCGLVVDKNTPLTTCSHVHNCALRRFERNKTNPNTLDISGKALVQMMQKASESLKFPHIHYKTERYTIKFGRGSKDARFPGAVYINLLSSLYKGIVGVIHTTGQVELSNNFKGHKFASEVLALLTQILHDPMQAFKINGQQHSNCCFCNTPIVTKESLAVGYGPICAAKFGLPWGEVNDSQAGPMEIGL